MRRPVPFLLSLLCLAAFALLSRLALRTSERPDLRVSDRVVISAPIQLLLAGGDRFLAADFEAVRLAATGSLSLTTSTDDAAFRIRAHRVVAQLNACHEDNYYVGNALLSWGGAPGEGSDLLRRAMDCRVWDELVPFLYGFNEFFFNRDAVGARRAYELAAQRSKKNASAFREMAIMATANDFDDEGRALDYLRRERDGASEPKLRKMLSERVGRLEGLIVLRDAQRRYEAKFGRPLTDPGTLLSSELLKAFPHDPLQIGYVFEKGEFRLKRLKIAGLEDAR